MVVLQRSVLSEMIRQDELVARVTRHFIARSVEKKPCTGMYGTHNSQGSQHTVLYHVRTVLYTFYREARDAGPPLSCTKLHIQTQKTRCGVYGDDLDAPANPGPRARPRRGLIAAPPARCWPPQSSGLCPGAPTGDRCYSSRAIFALPCGSRWPARCAALHAAASESLSST
jgi:hypothetical protein